MNEQNQTTHQNHLINLLFDDGLQNALPRIAEILMNAAMLLERETHIGAAPYQRGVDRNGYANGFKPRTFQTGIGSLELAVPQVRESENIFRTSLLEKGSRSERALKSAIATMYVEGVSTRRITKVMEDLCGFEVSSGQVSNLNKQLDAEFEKWRTRPLPPIAYVTLDATYYKVRIDGIVRDCATLIAYGIRRDDGKRMILGVSCALSEAEVHWRDFLNGLKERGIGIPDLVTSDAHSGLKAALKGALSGTPWQRCQFHLQQNAQEYVTKQHLKSKVATDIRGGARRQSYRGSCGFLVSGEPEVVKSVAQQESSEVQDVLRPLDGPEHARVFEPLSDDGFAACLDDAGADKEAL